jgi:hypothetical protein
MWKARVGAGGGIGSEFGGRSEVEGRAALGSCWSDMVAGGGESGFVCSINLGFSLDGTWAHGCASVQVEDGKGAFLVLTPSSLGNVKACTGSTATAGKIVKLIEDV